jgi:hypothetical protein
MGVEADDAEVLWADPLDTRVDGAARLVDELLAARVATLGRG